MGLREKVALAIVVILQIANALSVKENPFERYVGRKQCGKNVASYNSGISQSNYNAQGLSNSRDFGLSQSSKMYNFGAKSVSPTSNVKYDPALLENYKKEARRTRKNKKLQNVVSTPTQSPDVRPFVTEIGVFPEVEYPLCAMDAWTSKYKNSVPYYLDDTRIKQPSPKYQTQQPINTLNSKSIVCQKASSFKGNKGTQSSRKSKKMKAETDQNTKPQVKNKLQANNDNISNRQDQSINSDALTRRKFRKRIKNKQYNRKAPSKSFKPPRTAKIILKESSDSNNKSNKTCNVSNGNTTLNMCSLSSNNNQDKLNTNQQSKLDYAAYPNDDICKSENNESNTISKNVDPLMKCVSITNNTEVAQKYYDNSSIRTVLQTITNQPQKTEYFKLAEPTVLDNINPDQVAKLNPFELKNLAEEVVAQIGPVPEEYNLSKEYILPMIFSPYVTSLPSDDNGEFPDILKKFIRKEYQNEKRSEPAHKSNLINLYSLVENVLAEINLKQNIPKDALEEIITEIESLPHYYKVTNFPMPDRTTDMEIIKSTDYVPPNAVKMNNKMSEKLVEMSNTNKDHNFESVSTQINNGTPVAINKKNSIDIKYNIDHNKAPATSPLPIIDQCSKDDDLESNTYNISSSPITLMEILNGRSFESLEENYQSKIDKEVTPIYTIDLQDQQINKNRTDLQEDKSEARNITQNTISFEIIPMNSQKATNIVSENRFTDEILATCNETQSIDEKCSEGTAELYEYDKVNSNITANKPTHDKSPMSDNGDNDLPENADVPKIANTQSDKAVLEPKKLYALQLDDISCELSNESSAGNCKDELLGKPQTDTEVTIPEDISRLSLPESFSKENLSYLEVHKIEECHKPNIDISSKESKSIYENKQNSNEDYEEVLLDELKASKNSSNKNFAFLLSESSDVPIVEEKKKIPIENFTSKIHSTKAIMETTSVEEMEPFIERQLMSSQSELPDCDDQIKNIDFDNEVNDQNLLTETSSHYIELKQSDMSKLHETNISSKNYSDDLTLTSQANIECSSPGDIFPQAQPISSKSIFVENLQSPEFEDSVKNHVIFYLNARMSSNESITVNRLDSNNTILLLDAIDAGITPTEENKSTKVASSESLDSDYSSESSLSDNVPDHKEDYILSTDSIENMHRLLDNNIVLQPKPMIDSPSNSKESAIEPENHGGQEQNFDISKKKLNEDKPNLMESHTLAEPIIEEKKNILVEDVKSRKQSTKAIMETTSVEDMEPFNERQVMSSQSELPDRDDLTKDIDFDSEVNDQFFLTKTSSHYIELKQSDMYKLHDINISSKNDSNNLTLTTKADIEFSTPDNIFPQAHPMSSKSIIVENLQSPEFEDSVKNHVILDLNTRMSSNKSITVDRLDSNNTILLLDAIDVGITPTAENKSSKIASSESLDRDYSSETSLSDNVPDYKEDYILSTDSIENMHRLLDNNIVLQPKPMIDSPSNSKESAMEPEYHEDQDHNFDISLKEKLNVDKPNLKESHTLTELIVEEKQNILVEDVKSRMQSTKAIMETTSVENMEPFIERQVISSQSKLIDRDDLTKNIDFDTEVNDQIFLSKTSSPYIELKQSDMYKLHDTNISTKNDCDDSTLTTKTDIEFLTPNDIFPLTHPISSKSISVENLQLPEFEDSVKNHVILDLNARMSSNKTVTVDIQDSNNTILLFDAIDAGITPTAENKSSKIASSESLDSDYSSESSDDVSDHNEDYILSTDSIENMHRLLDTIVLQSKPMIDSTSNSKKSATEPEYHEDQEHNFDISLKEKLKEDKPNLKESHTLTEAINTLGDKKSSEIISTANPTKIIKSDYSTKSSNNLPENSNIPETDNVKTNTKSPETDTLDKNTNINCEEPLPAICIDPEEFSPDHKSLLENPENDGSLLPITEDFPDIITVQLPAYIFIDELSEAIPFDDNSALEVAEIQAEIAPSEKSI